MAQTPKSPTGSSGTGKKATTAQSGNVLRVADLAQRKATPFEIIPPSDVLTAIAAELELLGLKKLRFEGKIEAQGRDDWQLTGHLGATVTQPCVISLAPVTTRVEESVERVFVKDTSEFEFETDGEEEIEVELDGDDSREPLGKSIDLDAILIESLALALPPYPRAEGAALEETQFTEPGEAAMTDEEAKPFAGLANLLKNKENTPKS
ncbi:MULTISPECIES: YceD family protein [Halocynthiibacter]|uniref:DUF177 domain-containing protein n=1 Tax=Halocynthiibacter halioticoli TaxID=2986804 RepID=A0AAE3J2S3_9RHOB|nr:MULTISPECIES: DUF177 domain-containing protein [Halocynthiibacter]MCV6824237.1 DUF177 domain-containing protein [Halocynthiibacter halioticoli]MCW4057238.1 DUF177 domain-containing protein [Halocynthiibacter sp. SDUM655004]